MDLSQHLRLLLPPDVRSVDALAGLSAASRRRNLQKGEPLVLDPLVEGVFVSAGCLRVYFTEQDGSERTMYFAPDGWWLPRLTGCDAAASAAVAIDALEPTEVWLVLRGDDARSHALVRIWCALDEWALAAMQRRVLGAMRKTAADRYAEFHRVYPGLDGRIPQYHVAEYLGISPEFLSKMRSRLRRDRSRAS